MAADLGGYLVAKPTLDREQQPSNHRSSLHSDFAVAGVAEGVERERDQPGGDDAHQYGAVRVVHDLGQGAVEADSLVRIEVDRSFDQEDPDQPEYDHSRQVPDRPKAAEPPLDSRRHLLDFRVVEKLLRDAPVALVQSDAD